MTSEKVSPINQHNSMKKCKVCGLHSGPTASRRSSYKTSGFNNVWTIVECFYIITAISYHPYPEVPKEVFSPNKTSLQPSCRNTKLELANANRFSFDLPCLLRMKYAFNWKRKRKKWPLPMIHPNVVEHCSMGFPTYNFATDGISMETNNEDKDFQFLMCNNR